MIKQRKVNIVLGADDGYAMPLGVTMCSVLKNIHPHTELTIFILDGGISTENKKRVNRVFQSHASKDQHFLRWITPDLDALASLPTAGRPPAIYMPLFLPDYLPENCKTAIFLDCDLIVENDITKILEENLDQSVICAVQDYLIQTLADEEGVHAYKQLGGKADDPYFNSGVMVMNLELWREQNITEKAVNYLKSRKQIVHYDQEALNAVLIGKWKRLDPRWNQQGSIFWPQILKETKYTRELKESYQTLIDNPCIIHYLSPSKPWSYTCMHPFASRFTGYLKESNWYTTFEWESWWLRTRYQRFRWLFNDLKKTMQMMKPSNKRISISQRRK